MKHIGTAYHNLPIYYKILIWMLVVSIIPLSVIGILNLDRFLSMEVSRCRSEILNSLQWVENDVTEEIDALRLQSIRISLNPEVISTLAAADGSVGANRYQLEKILFDISISDLCHSACILGFNGVSACNSNSSELLQTLTDRLEVLYTALKSSGRTYMWASPISLGSTYLLPYVRFIRSADGADINGLFIANFQESRLAEISRKNMAVNDLQAENVLVLNDGIVLSSWDKSLIGKSVWDIVPETSDAIFDGEYNSQGCTFLTFENPQTSNWKYMAIVSHSEIHAASRSVITLILVMIALCLLFIFIASYMVSRSISKPLEYLSGAMLSIGNQNLNMELKYPQYHDEVGQMWRSLIDMTEMLKKTMADTQRAQEQNQRLRFEALKAQINPHFIYNTFSSVIFLIEDHKPEEATKMLTALADLLHISISRTMEFIPVEQELSLVRRYMDIQKVRYHNSFQYLIDVDLEMLKQYTVKIILQPVIENALEHGLKNRDDNQGRIVIRGWQERDLLIFEVIDNGGALSERRMLEVNAILRSPQPAPEAKVGIGLKNVNDRICYEFPGDDRLGVQLIQRGQKTVTRIVTKAKEAP